jgi:ABC-type histidine transport system ATPase subunit
MLRLTNYHGLPIIERSYNKNKNTKAILMPTQPQPNNALKVEDLHKSFGANEVLKGISMCAKDGEVWSIIGSSGSGKSTFLRCLNLLELPSQGAITIGDEAIEFKRDQQGHILRPTRQKQIQRLRTNMGMVFQNFNLWQHQTVLKNIIEAPIHVLGMDKAQAIDEAERLLNRVGLWDKRDAYPMHLSGGQQQRAAIARALAMQPKMMLFDEPTSALDPELVGEVLKVIRSIAEEGNTMIMVTHEMRFARDVSNQVMFLHEGRIEEQGSPKKVFNESESARCRAFVSSIN